MRKFVILSLAVALMLGSTSALAQTSTSASTTVSLAAQIASLLETMRGLQDKIAALRGQQKEVRQEIKETRKEFRSQLKEGMTSDEVRELQELLAKDPDLFPEGRITGFFGPLTRKAVERFQRKHGIEALGFVGPRTRMKLNEILAAGGSVNISITQDGVNWSVQNGSSTATSTHGMRKITLCHKEGRHGQHTISVATPAVPAHLFHGDAIGACKDGDRDDDDEDNATTTDSIAPVITDVSATTTTATSATILWTTNEPAKSTVRYATTTPVGSALNQLTTMDASLVTAHSVALTSLSASTTYYFMVESTDGSGNTATSSEMWFMTL